MPKTLLIPALLLPFVVACGGGAPEPATSEAPAEPTAVVVDAATAGGLTGTITLDGDAPAAEVIRMNADPVCVREVTDTVTTQYFVVGDDGGVGNVFVYVERGPEWQLSGADGDADTRPRGAAGITRTSSASRLGSRSRS